MDIKCRFGRGMTNVHPRICILQVSSKLSDLPDCPCLFWRACMSSCWCSGGGGCREVMWPGQTAAAHTAPCTDCWNWSGKSEDAPRTVTMCLRGGRKTSMGLFNTWTTLRHGWNWSIMKIYATLCVSETSNSLSVRVGPVRTVCQVG